MKLGTENESRIVIQVIESLVNEASHNSWTLVVPPGFGESFVPQTIVDRLRVYPAESRVAFLKADAVKTQADLVRQLSRQWLTDAPGKSDRDGSGEELADVLAKIDRNCKRVLVISRFHRMLDWVDESILQNLRDA